MKNTNIAERVRLMADLNRIPQAVLIEGNDALLRDSSAEYLAAAIVCTAEAKPCGACRDCKKAFAKIHPDITYADVEPKQKYIKVDDIRKIRKEAYIKPNEADFRVFVIKNADCMNEEAQNAILKLLEEPPENVGLILCAASRSRLLSTVRSRLLQINIDGESSEKHRLKPSKDVEKLLLPISMKDGYGLLKALNSVTNDRVSAARAFSELKTFLMAAISLKQTGESAEAYIQETASRLTVQQLLKLCDWCDSGVNKMNANANKGSATAWLSVCANRIMGV